MARATWRRTVEPTIEPVSLSDVKRHLRVDHDADDALIAALLTAARDRLEEHTGRAFAAQTWVLSLTDWPSGPIRLPRPPLTTVSSIAYVDEDGQSATWASSNYVVSTAPQPGEICLAVDGAYPTVSLRPGWPISITYTCGYSPLPQPLRAAILLAIGHLYENREAVGPVLRELPMGVVWLADPWIFVYEQGYP